MLFTRGSFANTDGKLEPVQIKGKQVSSEQNGLVRIQGSLRGPLKSSALYTLAPGCKIIEVACLSLTL